ncbi:hypothetical protein [Amycolatopsis minnesotensis]|uniref:hypothetical protein n=1 Tax=Amycolatopsis minnesotensis TaxID=337894 RepID=UPI0031D60C6D
MNVMDEFEPVSRTTVDSRRRVSVGQVISAAPGTRYSVLEGSDGSILLRPVRHAATAKESSDA